jgi:hypothetical protein
MSSSILNIPKPTPRGLYTPEWFVWVPEKFNPPQKGNNRDFLFPWSSTNATDDRMTPNDEIV